MEGDGDDLGKFLVRQRRHPVVNEVLATFRMMGPTHQIEDINT